MSAIGQSPAPQPTAQDLLTQAALSIQGAVAILAGTMQQSAAIAQALQQVQMMVGAPQQPTSLDDAAGGLQSDMQASAAQRGASY